MLDLRLPMGLMFSLVGAMMIVYGLCTWGGHSMTSILWASMSTCGGASPSWPSAWPCSDLPGWPPQAHNKLAKDRSKRPSTNSVAVA